MNRNKILKQYSSLSKYYDIFLDKKKYQREVELISDFLSKYKSTEILDVGCGTGWHSIFLAKRDFQVTGIDISKAMIDCAKENVKKANVNVEFLVGDMRNLNLKKKFDGVLYLHSFYYLTTNDDVKRALKTLSRHLNPNGIVIIFHISIFDLILSNSFQKNFLLEREEGKVKRITMIRHKIDTEKDILHAKEYHFIENENKTESFTCEAEYKIFTMSEIISHLENNGFEVVYSKCYSSGMFKNHNLIVGLKTNK
jgi:ubiquinone/menaquinone biosynthesis C-methylase UbiE